MAEAFTNEQQAVLERTIWRFLENNKDLLIRKIVGPDGLTLTTLPGKNINIDTSAGGKAYYNDVELATASKGIPDGTGGSNRKEIMVYYPEWKSPAEHVTFLNLDFKVVTTVAYSFAYAGPNGELLFVAVDKISSTYDPTAIIAKCHAEGVKCVLSIRDDNSNLYPNPDTDTLLDNPTAITNLVANIYAELVSRGFDGVDIDIEQMTASPAHLAAMTSLITQLNATLSAATPVWNGVSSYWISIAIGADKAGIPTKFDLPVLKPLIRAIMLMNYDWYGAWMGVAGPVAPLELDAATTQYPVGSGFIDSLKYVIAQVGADKTICGVPWYGKVFNTIGIDRLSPMVGGVLGSPVPFMPYAEYTALAKTITPTVDQVWKTPWFSYLEGYTKNPEFSIPGYGWAARQGTVGTSVFNDAYTPGRDGTGKCASLTSLTAVALDIPNFFQIFEIDPTKTYTLHFWYLTSNIVTPLGGVNVITAWANESWVQLAQSGLYSGQGLLTDLIWTEKTITYAPGDPDYPIPPTAKFATVQLQLENCTGTVWFDDVTFDESPSVGILQKQLHYDDKTSLGLKYDVIKSLGVAGIGVWEASNAGPVGSTELYAQIRERFGSGGTMDHGMLDAASLRDDDHKMYLPVTGVRGMTGNLIPDINNAVTCGSATKKWSNVWMVVNHVGDLAFSETKCPICDKSFELGEILGLQVIKVGNEINTIPVHKNCIE